MNSTIETNQKVAIYTTCYHNYNEPNVVDDLEYLADSEFFNKNNDILFHIDSEYHNELMNNDTRNYKTKLTIQGDSDTSENSDDMIELSNLNDFSELDEIFSI